MPLSSGPNPEPLLGPRQSRALSGLSHGPGRICYPLRHRSCSSGYQARQSEPSVTSRKGLSRRSTGTDISLHECTHAKVVASGLHHASPLERQRSEQRQDVNPQGAHLISLRATPIMPFPELTTTTKQPPHYTLPTHAPGFVTRFRTTVGHFPMPISLGTGATHCARGEDTSKTDFGTETSCPRYMAPLLGEEDMDDDTYDDTRGDMPLSSLPLMTAKAVPLSISSMPLLRVIVYDDVGGKSFNEKTGKICGAVHILQCLQATLGPRVIASTTTAEGIMQGSLRHVDLFIMPGGITTLQGKTIGLDGKRILQQYVATGGGYLGFCAGANLALCDRYPNNLELCPAVNLDPHYPSDIFWRGTGCVSLAATPAGQAILGTACLQRVCYFNGPLLGYQTSEHGLASDKGLQVIARFADQQLARKEPLPLDAVQMKGCAAILANTYKKGRVVVCSVHPEKPSCRRWDNHANVVARLALWAAQRLPAD